MLGKFGRVVGVLVLLVLVAPGVMAAGNGDTVKVFENVKDWQRFGIVLNNDTLDEARNLGVAMVDFGVASLESIKGKLEESNLSMKDEIIAEINEHITDLINAKEEIESAETVEELKEAMKKARETWRDAKVSLQKA